MKLGLFFGSFNPVHLGHLYVANQVIKQNLVDQILWVISPRSPHKKNELLLGIQDRIKMLSLAVTNKQQQLSQVELSLPRPNYTIDTVLILQKQYPKENLYLLVGYDNYLSFGSWKQYQQLLTVCRLLVYPRKQKKKKSDPVAPPSWSSKSKLLHGVDKIDISSSQIRSLVAKSLPFEHLVPQEVALYIKEMSLYKSGDLK